MNIKWLIASVLTLAGAGSLVALNGNGDQPQPDTGMPLAASTAALSRLAADTTLTPDEQNNIDVYQAASPSVVYVTNTQLRRQRFSFNVMEIPAGSGTGFIWDESGLIVTNFHVIYGAKRIEITLQSGKKYDAEVLGSAPEKDIALLRINAPEDVLTALPLGDSSNLAVGRKVLAIGNPFELDTSLTVGVISALGREIKSLTNRTINNVIQTDAAINPGNSGGPLLDSHGRLVGVNTSILSPSGANAGIGFAIPVNTVKNIVPQLIEHGRLYRPVLGVETLPDSWARRWGIRGVAVISVEQGMPADKAGVIGAREDRRGNIYWGDIIIAINDEPVTDQDTFLSQLEQHQPGETVKVTTIRDEKIHNYSVQLATPRD